MLREWGHAEVHGPVTKVLLTLIREHKGKKNIGILGIHVRKSMACVRVRIHGDTHSYCACPDALMVHLCFASYESCFPHENTANIVHTLMLFSSTTLASGSHAFSLPEKAWFREARHFLVKHLVRRL